MLCRKHFMPMAPNLDSICPTLAMDCFIASVCIMDTPIWIARCVLACLESATLVDRRGNISTMFFKGTALTKSSSCQYRSMWSSVGIWKWLLGNHCMPMHARIGYWAVSELDSSSFQSPAMVNERLFWAISPAVVLQATWTTKKYARSTPIARPYP